MQAEHCYQTHHDNTIPLHCVSTSEWETLVIAQEVRQSLYSQSFSAQLGEKGLILDESGQLRGVYIGQGQATLSEAIACAATLVPAGAYSCACCLSVQAQLQWSLAQYRFDRYKKQNIPLKTLLIAKDDAPQVIKQAEALFLIRDLINTPASDMTPETLAEVLSGMATRYGADFKQWVGDGLLEASYPAIHAVGRAASIAPRLLSLTWGNPAHPKVTLVGKGVCFDSGGLNIKPTQAMRLMKKDMGGAAHAAGLAQWIMAMQLPVRLQVYIPAVENAISAQSYRPGDVLTMRNGLTVEIDNTDAEGRLVLADALVKACEEKPDVLIDFATLTGAARVAVGTDIAAMFTPDNALADALYRSAEATGDPIWRLPLFTEYKALLRSNVADLTNASPSPYAGAITAALFLQRFVTGSTSWVHFDIMAWNVMARPGKPEGGEAMAVRALMHYLMSAEFTKKG